MEDFAHTSPQQPEHADMFFDASQNQPNTGKKRYRLADFRRMDVAPSRVNRIKEIFEDAASQFLSSTSVAGRSISQRDAFTSPARNWNGKVVRLSTHKTDSDYLIQSPSASIQPALPPPCLSCFHNQADIQLTSASTPIKNSEEPPNSGQDTPSRIPRPLRSPTRVACNAGSTYGVNSDDEDIHSTHRVPLVMPIHNTDLNSALVAEKVSLWLNSMEDTSAESEARRLIKGVGISPKHTSQKRNTKENVTPQRRLDAAKHERHEHKSSILKISNSNSSSKMSPRTPIRVAYGASGQKQIAEPHDITNTSPIGLLLLPPRRIGITPVVSRTSKTPTKTHNSEPGIPTRTLRCVENLTQNSKLINLDNDEGILPLSPSVTKYRRGRGLENTNHKLKYKKNLVPTLLNENQEFARALQEQEQEESENYTRRKLQRG